MYQVVPSPPTNEAAHDSSESTSAYGPIAAPAEEPASADYGAPPPEAAPETVAATSSTSEHSPTVWLPTQDRSKGSLVCFPFVCQDAEGLTPLHVAAQKGDLRQVARYLSPMMNPRAHIDRDFPDRETTHAR